MKGATNREAPSALAMATLLGASSPKTTCKNVMVAKATAKAIASVKPSGTERATNRGSRRCLKAGSPIHPKPSEEMVIPSWHTERYESSLSVAFLRSPDEVLPSRTSPSTCVERIFTSPNSAATNRPFRATRNKEDDQEAIEHQTTQADAFEVEDQCPEGGGVDARVLGGSPISMLRPKRTTPALTPLFTGVRGSGILGNSYPRSCIA